MKTCTKCGETKDLEFFYLKSGRDYHYAKCKTCHGGFDKPKNFANTWYKERFTQEELELFSCLKTMCTKAKQRVNREFDPDVDWEFLFDIWDRQNGMCRYSRVPLSIEANHPHKVSLDRIDSQQGYLKGNLQLVSATVNRMKQEFEEDLFLDLCKRIADNN